MKRSLENESIEDNDNESNKRMNLDAEKFIEIEQGEEEEESSEVSSQKYHSNNIQFDLILYCSFSITLN